jgi:hypothetical protein
MSVRTPRLAAPLALIALAVGACSDPSGPSPAESVTSAEPATAGPAAAAAQVYAYSAYYQGVVQVPLGDVVTECLAEPIEVHFDGRFRVMLAQTGNGQRSLSSVHMNDTGSWALGLATGTVYRLVGSSVERSNDGALGYGNGATTVTSSGFQQYVGPGGTGFTARSNFGFTVTPEGTLTVERSSSTIECR